MKRRSQRAGALFIDPSGQLRLVDKSAEQQALERSKVECLGMMFDSEDSRRGYFIERLREKLSDPDFRETPGFPKGTDEDIIRMSDPPWYTACPNPFLADFVRVYGHQHDPEESYEREPMAVDVTVGKTDPLYKAHGYHTKVPYLAIVPSILHYTQPGELVFDGFAGSGMTGVAAQWCETASAALRTVVEKQFKDDGLEKPTWGIRRSILCDLSPSATFLSANFNLPFRSEEFKQAAEILFEDLSRNVAWMYETEHSSGENGWINFTVWSEVYTCASCGGELTFHDHALDANTNRVLEIISCPHCAAKSTKQQLVLAFETYFDRLVGRPLTRPKRVPVLIDYHVGRRSFQKRPDDRDRQILDRIENLPLPREVPVAELPDMQMARVGRVKTTHTYFVHQFFATRALHVLSTLWRLARSTNTPSIRRAMEALAHHQLVNASFMNRYRPASSFGNAPLTGVLYVPSLIAEANILSLFRGTAKRIERMAVPDWQNFRPSGSIICTQSATAFPTLSDESIDYIFTDPPFGENIYYSDLNFIEESWHRIITDPTHEAIIDRARGKTITTYQHLMESCFRECVRLLKPGRWITVVFNNSSNAVWRAIQEALGIAGFVVADVRTLDKQQLSFKQVIGQSVKQDLVISAYKPTHELIEQFRLGVTTAEGAWAFVREHLGRVPVHSVASGRVEIIAERTAQVLHDRMVAFHVQRQLSVPLSTAEFLAGLNRRYPERDDMYFLPTQVAEYDRKRNTATELRQLSLFVIDEASAIQWVHRELQQKPRSFQDLQPVFMREIQNWAKHEKTVELKDDILRQNFLHYDASGPVPSQIHSYLSTNFKELRNLAKDDPALVAKAADRWYVPDPGKQIDLEKLRVRTLLSEFETYKQSRERKLKMFRTEAVRAGFKAAYDAQDYETIVAVAAKLPENVLQEDETLLMYFDVASMRLGDE